MSLLHRRETGPVAGAPGVCRPLTAPATLSARQWRQIAWLTLGAVGLFIVARQLPTGTNLNHMDFRAAGKNSLEFCDPSNPQFLPVVAVRSPVAMTLAMPTARAGEAVPLMVSLTTSTGKPIGPADLLVAHTQKLHLLIVDPTLADYQHLHPAPGELAGEWVGEFTPRRAGLYRVFADFTPAATGRGLYASTDLAVSAGPGAERDLGPAVGLAGGGTAMGAEVAGYRFALTTTGRPQVGQALDLVLTIARDDGGPVALEPIMGAWAHLVAFDEARSGFAHLHPNETDLAQAPDGVRPRLSFKVTMPQAGRYVVWAQVKIAGREVFAPFALAVGERG